MMSLSNPTAILLAIGLLAFLIGRQFTAQPVREGKFWLFPLAMTVYGVYLTSQTPPSGLLDISFLAVNLVGGAVLGFGRGLTMKLWRTQDGRLMQRGTLLTLGLWLLSIGLKVGAGFLSHGAFSTDQLPLFMGVTLGAQAIAMLLRIQSVGSRSADPFFETAR
jgi:hypothetical protein